MVVGGAVVVVGGGVVVGNGVVVGGRVVVGAVNKSSNIVSGIVSLYCSMSRLHTFLYIG